MSIEQRSKSKGDIRRINLHTPGGRDELDALRQTLVSQGDLVSTSPAGTILPPNLPIGVIQSFNKNSLPSPKALVQLIASPDAIDWVQVHSKK